MKQLMVIVKPFRAEDVLRAIAAFGVADCVVREAKGYSRQKNYLDEYRDTEFSLAFLPKVEVVMWVDDLRVEEIVRLVVEEARAGRMGDGKVFVLPVADSVRSIDIG